MRTQYLTLSIISTAAITSALSLSEPSADIETSSSTQVAASTLNNPGIRQCGRQTISSDNRVQTPNVQSSSVIITTAPSSTSMNMVYATATPMIDDRADGEYEVRDEKPEGFFTLVKRKNIFDCSFPGFDGSTGLGTSSWRRKRDESSGNRAGGTTKPEKFWRRNDNGVTPGWFF